MTERKYASYTLWMKWVNLGWRAEATCLDLPWPAANPREVLSDWVRHRYSHLDWKRGKNWMILGGVKTPKGK